MLSTKSWVSVRLLKLRGSRFGSNLGCSRDKAITATRLTTGVWPLSTEAMTFSLLHPLWTLATLMLSWQGPFASHIRTPQGACLRLYQWARSPDSARPPALEPQVPHHSPSTGGNSGSDPSSFVMVPKKVGHEEHVLKSSFLCLFYDKVYLSKRPFMSETVLSGVWKVPKRIYSARCWLGELETLQTLPDDDKRRYRRNAHESLYFPSIPASHSPSSHSQALIETKGLSGNSSMRF